MATLMEVLGMTQPKMTTFGNVPTVGTSSGQVGGGTGGGGAAPTSSTSGGGMWGVPTTPVAQNSSQSSGSSRSRSVSQTYLPGEKKAALNSLMQFLNNPMAGVQNILTPILESLVPSEQLARQNLSDEFRKAGALNTGAFAGKAASLEGDLYNRRTQEAMKAGLAYMQPLISGYVGALQGIPALSRSVSNSSSQQSGSSQGTGGAGGGGGGGTLIGFNTPSGLDRGVGNYDVPVNTNTNPFGTSDYVGAYQPSATQAQQYYGYNPSYFNEGPGVNMPSLADALNDPGMIGFDI